MISNKQSKPGVSATKSIALIGMFTALYIITAGIVGSFLGPFAHGYPEHFLRGFLMAGLVVRTRRMWSATMMGLASGLVFVLVVPSPAPYLLVPLLSRVSSLTLFCWPDPSTEKA